MKVLLSVIPQLQVAAELLDAMNKSIDHFSQGRSFDFRLVRIDQFLVPPTYVERYDAAWMSYWSERNSHPSREVMEPFLVRPRKGLTDDDCLQYAAVLYRSGEFGKDAHWGARFYLQQFALPSQPQLFIRLDCREIVNARDEAPSTFDIKGQLWLPDCDRFTLSWVLAWATRDVYFQDQREWRPRRSYPGNLADEIADEFGRFRSDVGVIDALAKKTEVSESKHARLLLRHAWASATMSKTRPSPFPGAGEHLTKLFESIKTEETK